MVSSGVLDNLKRKYINTSICNTDKHSTKPAQMVDVQGAFYAMAVGLGLALVCLMVEIIITKHMGLVKRRASVVKNKIK